MSWSARRLRKVVLALIVAGCAVSAAALYVGRSPEHRSIASGGGTSSVGPVVPSAPIRAVARADSKHTVLFVGASYTAGIGAEPKTNGYAYITAHALGWTGRYDAVPGSGYLNQGPPDGGHPGDNTFAARIAQLPAQPAPDLLVLQGGRNDGAYPPSELRAAVVHTVEVARGRFAHARIVLLGPIPASFPASGEEFQVAHTLTAAARSTGVDFVDPIAEGWITTENARGYVGTVPAHPDNAGYAFIAHRLVEDIDRLLGTTTAAASGHATS